MANFLTICNDVGRESGTFRDTALTTVVDQTGRNASLVQWVVQAYEEIQRSQENWRWLRTEFEGQLIADKRNYSAGDLSINDRFSHWIIVDDYMQPVLTSYKTSDGRAYEQHLRFVEYPMFRSMYDIAAQATQTGRPSVYSINGQNELVFYPTPDAGYTVRGLYYKAPQILAQNTDVPEMPQQFHRLIQWEALKLLGTFDEAFTQYPLWERSAVSLMGDLMQHQLPQIRMPGPLA